MGLYPGFPPFMICFQYPALRILISLMTPVHDVFIKTFHFISRTETMRLLASRKEHYSIASQALWRSEIKPEAARL